jgi:hypothetical protein
MSKVPIQKLASAMILGRGDTSPFYTEPSTPYTSAILGAIAAPAIASPLVYHVAGSATPSLSRAGKLLHTLSKVPLLLSLGLLGGATYGMLDNAGKIDEWKRKYFQDIDEPNY